MSVLDTRLSELRRIPGGKVAGRLMHELSYARRVSQVLDGRHEPLILRAMDMAQAAFDEDGVLTDRRALEIEQTLMPMQADCKKYHLMLCGHAHIDMNWMWRYDETVQITLDTFRTVLRLMDEFPGFTFSQSQASVYRIVEENAPDMLEQIRQRVQEGRWEVSASTWVEADRNMASAEAVARHHLYTLNYLPRLLGIDRPRVDFEPDTFGHHQNTPELLSQAGVRYYYHCRGLDGQTLYRWRAPSGAEVLAYREPFWYNDAIRGDIAEYAPEFCETFGVQSALRVYGVGDHGGGPTRRDLQRIVDMQSWPIYATVEFGTYARFFEQAERATKPIPVVDHELNALFVGCYTTQTRIKKGNRYGERLMAEAEGFNALAHVAAGAAYRGARFEEGWRNVLFNQFHDILPGSGVADTREYAMGLYQQSYAVANSARRLSMKAIADRIDTSRIQTPSPAEEVSGGAGVGFGVEERIDLAAVEVGHGPTRIFHLFNACAFDREEVTELTVWDYLQDQKRMEVTDAAGNPLAFQVIESGHNTYWGHDFTRVLVRARVPAMGYATVVVRQSEDLDDPVHFIHYEGVEKDETWSLENDLIEVECDPAVHHGALVITEKQSGEMYVVDGFHFLWEDASRGMTAWVAGDPLEDVHLSSWSMKRTASGPLYGELQMKARLGERSEITCVVGLAAGSARVTLDVECRWLESADLVRRRVPQLFFKVMADDVCRQEYVYDIPGGVIERSASAQDLPGIRFIAGGRLMLMSDCKYGYRGDVGSMGVTLIRGACDPDPYPELGVHRVRLAVALTENGNTQEMVKTAGRFMSPLTAISGESHAGALPADKSFVRVKAGTVELNAVKLSEDGQALVVRGVELTGEGKDVCLEIALPVKEARLSDTLEKEGQPVRLENGCVRFNARPFGMFTLRLTL